MAWHDHRGHVPATRTATGTEGIAMEDFGTDPRKIRRNDHPDTSHKAAETVKTAEYETLAYQIHQRCGFNGCTLDDLREAFQVLAPPNTQYANRRTGLHQKGLILDTGIRRAGSSGRQQAVYMVREILSLSDIEWIKNHPLAHNPCLEEENEPV